MEALLRKAPDRIKLTNQQQAGKTQATFLYFYRNHVNGIHDLIVRGFKLRQRMNTIFSTRRVIIIPSIYK